MGSILRPILTATPGSPPDYNFGMAETFSYIPVAGAGRPLYAKASYVTNFSDMSISLSAGELNIGSVTIKDQNSGISCDVVTDPDNNLNALRVITQDLESTYDDVTIGDKAGNFVSVDKSLSALRVLEVSPLTSINISNTVNVSGSVTITNPTTSIRISNTVDVSGSVTLLNPVTSLSITNQLTGITVLNPVTSVNVLNNLSATILNPITAVTITNPVTQLSATILNPSFTVLNPISSVSLTNPTTAVYIINTVEVSGSITVTNPTTAVNILNSISLKDLNNNNVTVVSATSSLNVNVTNPVEVTVNSSGSFPVTFAHTPNFDAFGRLRTSSPLTLFDSSHRYRDNNLWSSLTSVGGTYSFNPNQGLIEMTVNNLSGSSVIRETTKVFAYQPGKSLLTLNTFVMAPSATNLRQRVGYFGQDNGMYFQLDGGVISFVERSLINGSPSTETIVPLSAWNGDKMDGTGPSKLTLDITKAQILWTDIEWLGLGTVRMGFVINGQFIVCHSFHHANIIASTYITTASLPLRYEITNKEATGGTHTMKQVCSTVISEGGYELRGLQQAVSIPITAPRTFAVAGTLYPVISIRLKTTPDRLDAIVILTALSVLGKGNGINYNWQVRASGITTGGSWVDAGADSAVEYNITGTSYAGGRILASGFLNSSNQGSPNLDVLKEALFKFQLERNNLTKTPYEITLVAATDTENGSGMFASMDWEEISR